LEDSAAASLRTGVQVMGDQMQRFTDESTRLLQTMGSSVSQFLEEMSQNTERGIAMVETQVKGLREDANRHLEAMGNNVTKFLGELMVHVDKAGEAFNEEIMPRTMTLLDNVNITVKKTHTVIDIGILILVLFGFFVSSYLRLRNTNQDIFSLCSYFILGLLEMAFLTFAIHKFAQIFQKQVTDKDIEKELAQQLAIATACLIVFVIVIILAVKLIVILVRYFTVPKLTNDDRDDNDKV
jgi:hypothetical protein